MHTTLSESHYQLQQLLQAEKHALEGFIVILQREQALLLENNTQELLNLAQQKSVDAQKLNQLADTRQQLLLSFNVPLEANSITSWLEHHLPNCVAIWQYLMTHAKQAQQLNSVNGELIQMHLRHNQQALHALNRAANKTSLYGANGQQNFHPVKGRTLGKI